MRRLVVLVSLLAVVCLQDQAFAGSGRPAVRSGIGPAAAQLPAPPDNPARGVDHTGLRLSGLGGPCPGNYEIDDLRDRAGRALCTHGPDPAPPGVDVRVRRDFTAPALAAPGSGTAAEGALLCDGDGTTGNRVQLLYVHATDVTDRSASLAPDFAQWATRMDNVFSASAAETGGDRHVRFVHDAACNPIVTDVAVSRRGDDSFDRTLDELRKQGYTRSDRKYVAWVDATKYCGIGQVYYDDSPGPSNASNGASTVPGELARIDSGCWGQTASVEAHELMHTLGGVQTSAPNATPNNHCTDESDRMCYADAPGVTLKFPCPPSHETLFDCNHDDYFHTAPPAGSYLATHWNTASNSFLIGAGGSGGTPTTTTTIRPTTTTTRPGSTTTTTRPQSTTTTTVVAPPGTVPSAPQGLSASQPATGTGIVLKWSPPAANGGGPVSSYRIYRGAGPSTLALLTTVGSTGYTDTGVTTGTIAYYQVTAVNSAGESPRSNYTAMVAK